MIVAIVTGAFLLAFGLWYAWWEFARPIYPTRLAVAIGVAVTMTGQVVMVLALHHYGTAGLLTGVLAPFALTGIPMYVAQEFKDRCFADEGNRCKRGTGPLSKLEGKNADTQKETPSTPGLGS